MSDKSSDELGGWAATKPIRVAFLVEECAHSALVLDGIFADCHSRWGGRYSLVVPCKDGAVCERYWPWLDVFDPDIVYSYVKLPPEAVLDIHERLAPSDYLYGELEEPLRTTGLTRRSTKSTPSLGRSKSSSPTCSQYPSSVTAPRSDATHGIVRLCAQTAAAVLIVSDGGLAGAPKAVVRRLESVATGGSNSTVHRCRRLLFRSQRRFFDRASGRREVGTQSLEQAYIAGLRG